MIVRKAKRKATKQAFRPRPNQLAANSVKSVTKVHEHDRFIVLASDGVWDVYTDDEVVDLVERSVRHTLASPHAWLGCSWSRLG